MTINGDEKAASNERVLTSIGIVNFPEEILNVLTPNISELIGKSVVIQSIEAKSGDYGVYLILSIVDMDSGDVHEYQTGGKLFVSKLIYLELKGLLPIQGKVIVRGKTLDLE